MPPHLTEKGFIVFSSMGEVVTAICEAGMRIVFLHEYPRYFYGGYTPYDVENDTVQLYPCTFSLKAVPT
jgi:hypothetical protein